MTAVVELVLTTPDHARAAAIDAAVGRLRAANRQHWDCSDDVCQRILDGLYRRLR